MDFSIAFFCSIWRVQTALKVVPSAVVPASARTPQDDRTHVFCSQCNLTGNRRFKDIQKQQHRLTSLLYLSLHRRTRHIYQAKNIPPVESHFLTLQLLNFGFDVLLSTTNRKHKNPSCNIETLITLVCNSSLL